MHELMQLIMSSFYVCIEESCCLCIYFAEISKIHSLLGLRSPAIVREAESHQFGNRENIWFHVRLSAGCFSGAQLVNIHTDRYFLAAQPNRKWTDSQWRIDCLTTRLHFLHFLFLSSCCISLFLLLCSCSQLGVHSYRTSKPSEIKIKKRPVVSFLSVKFICSFL